MATWQWHGIQGKPSNRSVQYVAARVDSHRQCTNKREFFCLAFTNFITYHSIRILLRRSRCFINFGRSFRQGRQPLNCILRLNLKWH